MNKRWKTTVHEVRIIGILQILAVIACVKLQIFTVSDSCFCLAIILLCLISLDVVGYLLEKKKDGRSEE
jgi:hypothetical protein